MNGCVSSFLLEKFSHKNKTFVFELLTLIRAVLTVSTLNFMSSFKTATEPFSAAMCAQVCPFLFGTETSSGLC